MIFQKEYWERKKLMKRRSPNHPVVRAYVLPKIKEVLNIVGTDKKIRLLDMGCGNGFFTFYFDKIYDTYGIDYSQSMLAINPAKKASVMDVRTLGFKDDSFDVVFCNALLHHVEDLDMVIGEMKRVSRKYVIVIEPNRNNPLMFLFSALVKEEWKALRFSMSYIKNVVTRNGLHVLSSFSTGMVVPNKAPVFLLPVLNMFNFKFFFGMSNFLIAAKS
jgi:SAM-dependent methyltransferase